MPELIPKERLQPSLLDRLTDDEPYKTVEPREKRVLSMARLQESVIRDLAWLLNTEHLANSQEMDDCPLACASVINYGIPTISGVMSADSDPRLLARQVREAIVNFEPRLERDSVKVEVNLRRQQMSLNTLRFEIEAVLWAQPLPVQLLLHTWVDLETGNVEVKTAD